MLNRLLNVIAVFALTRRRSRGGAERPSAQPQSLKRGGGDSSGLSQGMRFNNSMFRSF